MSKEKYQMALYTLYMIASAHLGFELNCEKNLLQELVDVHPEYLELKAKGTPKRVIGLSITHDGLVGNCPNCNKFVRQQDSKPNVCECTQMLDWSKNE